MDNSDKAPASLSELYPDYVAEFSTFQHPGYKSKIMQDKSEIDNLSAYILFKGLPTLSALDQWDRTILIYEKDLYSEGGRNVGFVDGHVQWMREEEFQKRLKEQTAETEEE